MKGMTGGKQPFEAVVTEHAATVLRVYLAGLPYAEVAAIVGGSADAVRRAAADGIAALRRSYPGAAGTAGTGAAAPVTRTAAGSNKNERRAP